MYLLKRVKMARRFSTRSSGNSGKLKPYAFSNALGIVSAIAIVLVYIMSLTTSYNGQIIVDQYPLSGSLGINSTSFLMIITLIEAYVLSYIAGWIFVMIYNKTSKN